MKELFLVALAAWLTASQAAESGHLTGNELLPGNETKADREASYLYINGFVEGHVIAQAKMTAFAKKSGGWDALAARADRSAVFCPPEGVTPNQANAVVRKWLQDNPARLHERAYMLIPAALAEAWPCQWK